MTATKAEKDFAYIAQAKHEDSYDLADRMIDTLSDDLGLPKIRTAYDPTVQVGIDCSGDEPITKQADKDECDINVLMSHYTADQLAEHAAAYKGQYGDFTGDFDYQTALNRVKKTEEMFSTLPADVRQKYNNDPGEFVNFLAEATPDQLKEAGLVPDDVPPVDVVDPTPPSPPPPESK